MSMLKPFGSSSEAPAGGSDMQARMFAGALKALGLDPKVIEKLSNGLLHDIHTVSGMMPEVLARLEYVLRVTDAAPGSPHANAWGEYCEERRKELAGYEQRERDARNGGGSDAPAPGDA